MNPTNPVDVAQVASRNEHAAQVRRALRIILAAFPGTTYADGRPVIVMGDQDDAS